VTIEDALSDLPRIESNSSSINYLSIPKTNYQRLMRKKAPKFLMDHNSSKHGENLTTAMKYLPEGGLKNDIPARFRPKSGYSNSYGRLWWKKPSTTITRNFGTPSSARCIHPKVNRALTTREGARLQSFPDWFRFYGSRAKKNLQIGNAVPPILSERIGQSIVNSLDSL
ncbi:MAG: DNA cytosine methyltransferase, partial [Pseudomonadota bacterium]|nr:DNA cytosine methyltransferase [Pseudomonadota bacterium]